jgi:hypothetical protein
MRSAGHGPVGLIAPSERVEKRAVERGRFELDKDVQLALFVLALELIFIVVFRMSA